MIPHEHEQNSVSFFILNEITQISNSISVSNPQVSNRQTLANQGKELCPIADRDRLFHWVNTEPLTLVTYIRNTDFHAKLQNSVDHFILKV